MARNPLFTLKIHLCVAQSVAANLCATVALSSLPWTKWGDSLPEVSELIYGVTFCVIFPILLAWRTSFGVASFDPLPLDLHRDMGWKVGQATI